MLPFQRVLFPVDYSSNCDAVVPYVNDWADRFGASIKLVHVYGLVNVPYDFAMTAAADWPEDLAKYERTRLQEYAAKHFPGRRVEVDIEHGETASSIHKVVERDGTDVVMMPTHGYGPIRRLLLGSTTAKLLHDIATPFWTASQSVLRLDIPRIPCRAIVCAVDGSDEREAIVVAGDRLAHRFGAKLSLVRASLPVPGFPEIDVSGYQAELADAAEQELAELRDRHAAGATYAVRVAPALDAIRCEILKRKADLLVVGRGNSQDTFTRMFSNLYPIIRDAGCPVLSI